VPRTDAPLIRRFGPTERALHWVHAAGFLAMLATGLVLYLPVLSELVAHLLAAVAWVLALAMVLVVGDRARVRADWREIESFDADDRRWLRGGRAPQGRFNAGQKVNTILTVSFAVLFVVSGSMLWLGERDHRFILDGTGTVHELLTLGSVGLLVGHLYLAVIHPTTRHALRGMTLGDVREDWAHAHHSKWVEQERSLRDGL
jgi:formate dehydrogenase subunit gamma